MTEQEAKWTLRPGSAWYVGDDAQGFFVDTHTDGEAAVEILNALERDLADARAALDAFPFVRKTVTSGSGEGLTRLAFKGDYDIPLDGQAISSIQDWLEEHVEALSRLRKP